MRETSKSIARRLRDPAFVRYFAGRGIDVGSGDDSLGQWQDLFPLMEEIVDWDLIQGDAQYLAGVPEWSFDFLHSSHCLEHVLDPRAALRRWCEVVRPGGHVVVLVPDEDLYEQGVWPSRWNGDHKHSFTLSKAFPWSPASVNVFGLLASVAELARPLKAELLHSTCLPGRPGIDQTTNVVSECSIEFVLQRLL